MQQANNIPSLDYTRFGKTTIDVEVMQKGHAVIVGCGGGRLTAELLARSGIGKLTLIDPDTVDGNRNPLTQGHFSNEHGVSKALATSTACLAINSTIQVLVMQCGWAEAIDSHRTKIETADVLLACTDSYHVNRDVRKFGLKHRIDVIEGWIWPSGSCVEHVVTFPEIVESGGGCGTCHLHPRHIAHENGFKNVEVDAYSIPSALSCVQMAFFATSRLHYKAGSDRAISKTTEQLLKYPAQFTRLDPSLTAPFADTTEDHAVLATKVFAKDWPDDWQCPDCGNPVPLTYPGRRH